MSKITICKGNIIMTSKGDTTFHTFDGSIVSTAGGSNYWGGEQGTIVGDYEPMELPNKTSIPIIKSKCLVHFRPKRDWKGEEYGFDWMRESYLGDGQSYRGIVRKQYIKDKPQEYENLETNYNNHEGTFGNDDDQLSITMFEGLKSEYGIYRVPWKKWNNPQTLKKEPMEYYPSWLCVYPNTPCTLSLRLVLGDPSIDKIYLVPPKGVQVSPSEIAISAFQSVPGAIYKELIDGITVTVTGEGDTLEKKAASLATQKSIIAQVEVKGKRHLVGELKIWPNAPENQKTAHVTLVMVSTQTVVKKDLDNAKKDAINYFKKYLPQALVQVEVKEDFLDLSNDTSFREQYLTDGFIKAYYEKALTKEEQKNVAVFLKNKCQEEETFYKEHYVAFYFYQNEGFSMKKEEVKEGKDKKIIEKVGDPLGGYYSPSENILILFSDINEVAPTHELCHMIGLDHSFANREYSNNEYTFICGQTDNIMDYFSLRFSLWKWQWKFIQENVK